MCHVRERFDIVKTARLRVPKDPIMIPLQPTMHSAKKERCVDFLYVLRRRQLAAFDSKKRSVCRRIIKTERAIRPYQRQTLVVTGTTYARYTRSQYRQQRYTSSKRYLYATPRTEYGRGPFLSLSNLRA